jgi:hypothetical protein
VVKVLREFGFDIDTLHKELFLEKEQVIRMGVPPIRIELLTSISGVEFTEYFNNRIHENWDDIGIDIINLEMLKKNKRASARQRDLTDLKYLE